MAHNDTPAHATIAGTPPATEPRGLRTRLLDRFFHEGHVTETEQIAARMRRIRIGGPALHELNWTPGQQIRIATGDPEAEGVLGRIGDLRTYSVWHHDPDAGEVHICVMDHGDGPGAAWGREAKPGLAVRFRGPEGSFTLRPDAPYHLFAGEETASVAFGPMLRTIRGHVPVYGAIETATEADRLPLHRALALDRPVRGSASAARSQTLLDAIRAIDLPAEPGVAYLAGEARTIQMISGYLVRERHWPRRSVVTKPFWTPGKRGMD
jgi:NADPH-dependent ferric siderophore reductase